MDHFFGGSAIRGEQRAIFARRSKRAHLGATSRPDLEVVPPRQLNGYEGDRWRSVVPTFRKGRYVVKDIAITGDAPKNFVHVYEYGRGERRDPESWPAYIAKVGHKWYPMESITEQLLTRVGECLGLKMASSRLMSFRGQIRFLSRFFLEPGESLAHGAEILAGYLEDDRFVEEVADQTLEQEIFTFQVLSHAIGTRFPDQRTELCRDFARMLGFDALVGNQDRHMYNRGVIVHPTALRPPRFSPIYDTARGLFWQVPEDKLFKFRDLSAATGYIRKARPVIGWDGEPGEINHFRLIECIASSDAELKQALLELAAPHLLDSACAMMDIEFGELMSAERRNLIKRCLAVPRCSFLEALGGSC